MTSTAAAAEERQQHLQWRSLVPYIYDWFTNHQLAWPSLTCRCALCSCSPACLPAHTVKLGFTTVPNWPRTQTARLCMHGNVLHAPMNAGCAACPRRSWGPLVDGAPEKSRQRIYLSEQV